MRPIRIVIVDDSPFVVSTIKTALKDEPLIEIVGATSSGREAVALARSERPDVILLDLAMPDQDGVETTRLIMETCPTRILLLTAADRDDLRVIQALKAGAVDILRKGGGAQRSPFLKEQSGMLVAKIREVGAARLPGRAGSGASRAVKSFFRLRGRYDVIVIGVSTGGPAVLARIFTALPADFPVPILVVQHIINGHSAGLARLLQNDCRVIVKESAAPEPLAGGTILIARTGTHLEFLPDGRVGSKDGAPVNGFQPAADRLFLSAAEHGPSRILGLILTGMGNDGVAGARRLHEFGQTIIIQDEASSAVWGMPGEVHKLGCYDKMLSLEQIVEIFRTG